MSALFDHAADLAREQARKERQALIRRRAATNAPIAVTLDKREVFALLCLLTRREDEIRTELLLYPGNVELTMGRERIKALREKLEAVRAEQMNVLGPEESC